MRRVMIVGGSGSGKSTLARQIADRAALPLYHMDHIHWRPGWQPRPKDERRSMALEIEARDAWIFEGGFSTTYANRLSRADTLIWLDLPVALRMWRVTWRLAVHYGQRRPDMAEGCNEGIHDQTWAFYRWIWETRHTGRARLATLIADAPEHVATYHLRTRRQIRQFVEAL